MNFSLRLNVRLRQWQRVFFYVWQIMNYPVLRSMLGAMGVFFAWGAYGTTLYQGFPLVMHYANDYGSCCATVRLANKIGLEALIPLVILVSGAGWGISAASKRFSKTARLGFIGATLTSLFWLAMVNTLLRTIVRTSG